MGTTLTGESSYVLQRPDSEPETRKDAFVDSHGLPLPLVSQCIVLFRLSRTQTVSLMMRSNEVRLEMIQVASVQSCSASECLVDCHHHH